MKCKMSERDNSHDIEYAYRFTWTESERHRQLAVTSIKIKNIYRVDT